MFEKNMRLTRLLDFYGEALDDRTRSIMRAYYEDDLSLAEIAQDEDISRQGVRHIIKKGEEQLEFFETKLELASHYEELSSVAQRLTEIRDILTRDNKERYSEEITSLSEIIAVIISKGI